MSHKESDDRNSTQSVSANNDIKKLIFKIEEEQVDSNIFKDIETNETKPIQPDEVESEVDLGESPTKSNSTANQDQGRINEESINFKDLIFGKQLLRGRFGEDIFTGKVQLEPENKPLISFKEPEESEIAHEEPSPVVQDTPKETPKLTPALNTNYEQHNQKVKEIVEMIQRNKNNYYFKIFMDQAKEKNDKHAYLHNKAHLEPFSYTKFKIPITNTETDLVPLEPNKKLRGSQSTPEIKDLESKINDLKNSKNERKIKVKKLIQKRNDREYYLGLNTNPFKVKLQHLGKMNTAIQAEIDNKIYQKQKQIVIWKQRVANLKNNTQSVSSFGQDKLFNRGMTSGQLKSFMQTERELKSNQYSTRQMVKQCERELQMLEHKKVRYKNEFDRKRNILKIQKSEFRDQHQFHYAGHLKTPGMKKSLTRKRVLLHDTLHSKLKMHNKITAFETKEGEQYTIDLLRKAEEKDMEEQMKFLDRLAQKEAKEREELRKKREERKRLASARPFYDRTQPRKERCLSAIMKKQEEAYYSSRKKDYVPPEMMINFQTLSSTHAWSQLNFEPSKTQKFSTQSSFVRSNNL